MTFERFYVGARKLLQSQILDLPWRADGRQTRRRRKAVHRGGSCKVARPPCIGRWTSYEYRSVAPKPQACSLFLSSLRFPHLHVSVAANDPVFEPTSLLLLPAAGCFLECIFYFCAAFGQRVSMVSHARMVAMQVRPRRHRAAHRPFVYRSALHFDR